MDSDIQEIPSATRMFSTMSKSMKHVPSWCYNFLVPEMEMVATKPEVSVFLTISQERIEIFKKFQVQHLCFRLCPSQGLVGMFLESERLV